MKNDIVEELLADLIAKCEGQMTSPFKKKAETVTAIITPKDDAEVEEPAEDDDLDEATVQKLIEAYKKSR